MFGIGMVCAKVFGSSDALSPPSEPGRIVAKDPRVGDLVASTDVEVLHYHAWLGTGIRPSATGLSFLTRLVLLAEALHSVTSGCTPARRIPACDVSFQGFLASRHTFSLFFEA